MLPNATVDQKIASGFHRNAMTNEEGGVDPEESLYEVLVDRANTTATVWLGTTLACAQCHNHKYDPFTQKDYYRLLAFFANTEYESTTFGDGTRFAEARLDLATAEEEKTRQRLQADIDQADRELKTVTPEVREAQAQWELSMRTAQAAWTPLAPRDVARDGRRRAHDTRGRFRARVRRQRRADVLHRHGRHDASGNHRAPHRNAARSVSPEGRTRTRRATVTSV